MRNQPYSPGGRFGLTLAHFAQLRKLVPMVLHFLPLAALAGVLAGGCDYLGTGGGQKSESGKETAKGQPNPNEPVPPKSGQGKKTQLSKNVFLEILPDNKRLVLLEAKVCRREGMLEHLLCKNKTKEHEAILHADIDAAFAHAALLAAGAEVGKPVQFDPKYVPASGSVIKVWVQYKDQNGKVVTELAQKWIRDVPTKKEMAYDWVFAGSRRDPDPTDNTKPGYYAANQGDVICLANFPTSMLDLMVGNVNDNSRLDFEPITERIPPIGTAVTVILEPVLKK